MKLLQGIYDISIEKWVDINILLGISWSESRLLTDFKPYHCVNTNNPAGIKRKKNNDWTVNKIKLPTSSWCWLYSFETIEAGFESLANTIRQWYINAWCNDLDCIAYKYVGDPKVSESSRKNRVKYFINYK